MSSNIELTFTYQNPILTNSLGLDLIPCLREKSSALGVINSSSDYVLGGG
jgi:hypothetical protein